MMVKCYVNYVVYYMSRFLHFLHAVVYILDLILQLGIFVVLPTVSSITLSSTRLSDQIRCQLPYGDRITKVSTGANSSD